MVDSLPVPSEVFCVMRNDKVFGSEPTDMARYGYMFPGKYCKYFIWSCALCLFIGKLHSFLSNINDVQRVRARSALFPAFVLAVAVSARIAYFLDLGIYNMCNIYILTPNLPSMLAEQPIVYKAYSMLSSLRDERRRIKKDSI
jgi:hypothetical protein